MTPILLLLSLIQGVTLRGTVWEAADKPVPGAIVTLSGEDVTLQTTSSEDGTFKFALPRAGTFQLSAKRGKLVGRSSTLFVGQDMDGVGIVLKPLVSPLVFGSIKVEGDQPLPEPLPRIVITYTSGTIFGRFDIDRRGLFFFVVSPLEFNVRLEGLKQPYVLKSIMFGNLDLMKNSLKLTEVPTIQPIAITLGIRR